MNLEDTLVENLLKSYGTSGKSVQTILDNQLFRDLPLTEKVRLIKKYEGDLSKAPNFNWTSIGVSGLRGGVSSVLSLAIAQRIANMHSTYGLIAAGALGLGIGAANQAYVNRSNYARDRSTSEGLSNPLQTLVSRYSSSVRKPLDFSTGGSVKLTQLPEVFGKIVSKADMAFEASQKTNNI